MVSLSGAPFPGERMPHLSHSLSSDRAQLVVHGVCSCPVPGFRPPDRGSGRSVDLVLGWKLWCGVREHVERPCEVHPRSLLSSPSVNHVLCVPDLGGGGCRPPHTATVLTSPGIPGTTPVLPEDLWYPSRGRGWTNIRARARYEHRRHATHEFTFPLPHTAPQARRKDPGPDGTLDGSQCLVVLPGRPHRAPGPESLHGCRPRVRL